MLVEIHIKQGENISLAIQKELISQGANKEDFNASIWNQLLNLVDEQNEQNKADGKERLYQGGNTRKPANWQKNYKVFAGQVLKFSEGIWNRMKAVVGLKPDTLQASNQEALTGNLSGPASPFGAGNIQTPEKLNTIPVPQNTEEAPQLPSAPAQPKTPSNPSPIPFGAGADVPTPASMPLDDSVMFDEPARVEEEIVIQQPEDENVEGEDYSNPLAKRDAPNTAFLNRTLAPQAPIQTSAGADAIPIPESDNLAPEVKPQEKAQPKLLASGAQVLEDGTIVLGDESYSIDENGQEVVKTKYGTYKPTNAMNREVIANIRAKLHGLESTNLTGIYRNSEGEYFKWDSNKREYVKANVATPESEAKKAEAAKAQQVKMEEFTATKANGVLESFSQEGKGDCWLISSLKALNNSEAGRAALKESISADSEGNVTVNLKGVGKTYTVTAEEINQAIQDENAALGDKDAVAIEIAFEKYVKEGIENKQTNYNENSLNKKRQVMGDDYLYGGRPKVAIETLTGKSVSTISRSYSDSNIVIQDHTAILKSMSEETLKPYMDNPNNIIVVSLDGADERREGEGHGFAFKGYDDEFVYLENTYLNDDGSPKIEKFAKDDFYSRLREFSYTELNSPMDKKSAERYYTPATVISKEVEEYEKRKEAEGENS